MEKEIYKKCSLELSGFACLSLFSFCYPEDFYIEKAMLW